MILARKPALFGILLVLLASVTSCSQSYMDRQARGQILGGVAGAAIGSLFGSGTGKAAAIGAGAILGTIAGGSVARR